MGKWREEKGESMRDEVTHVNANKMAVVCLLVWVVDLQQALPLAWSRRRWKANLGYLNQT